MALAISPVDVEEVGQRRPSSGLLGDMFLDGLVRTDGNSLLVLQVDGQLQDGKATVVSLEPEDAPERLVSGYVAFILELPDLIDRFERSIGVSLQLHGGVIESLVDVFVDVLYQPIAHVSLDVDMGVPADTAKRVLGSHILVGEGMAVLPFPARTALVTASIGRLRIRRNVRLLLERARELVAASTLDHTGRVRTLGATQTVQHIADDYIIEQRLRRRVRDFGPDCCINVICCRYLRVRMQDKDNIGMEKAPFLKLNGVTEGSRLPRDTNLADPVKQLAYYTIVSMTGDLLVN